MRGPCIQGMQLSLSMVRLEDGMVRVFVEISLLDALQYELQRQVNSQKWL